VVNAADRFWNILRQQILGAQISGPLSPMRHSPPWPSSKAQPCAPPTGDLRRFQGLKSVDPIQPAN
jgi:hypothetical protein